MKFMKIVPIKDIIVVLNSYAKEKLNRRTEEKIFFHLPSRKIYNMAINKIKSPIIMHAFYLQF